MAQIVKKGNRKYMVRVFRGVDPVTGKRKFYSKVIPGTKKTAQEHAEKIERQVRTGTFHDGASDTDTVKEFMERWLDETAKIRVSERTLSDYRLLAKKHVYPSVGAIPVRNLKPAAVQGMIGKMGHAKKSPRTIRNALAVLRTAMQSAVRQELLERNPAMAKELTLPKNIPRELTVFNPEQARAFLKVCVETMATIFAILIATGARPSEVLGLKWPDFDGKTIHIQRALTRISNGSKWSLGPPKTAKSRRAIPLIDGVIELLEEHRRRQMQDRRAAGKKWKNHNFIFADEFGEPLRWRTLGGKVFVALLEEAELPKIRPYDLRHTCATLLLSGGINPKVVSERLGHSTVGLTLDTYSSVLPGLQEKATEKLGEFLS